MVDKNFEIENANKNQVLYGLATLTLPVKGGEIRFNAGGIPIPELEGKKESEKKNLVVSYVNACDTEGVIPFTRTEFVLSASGFCGIKDYRTLLLCQEEGVEPLSVMTPKNLEEALTFQIRGGKIFQYKILLGSDSEQAYTENLRRMIRTMDSTGYAVSHFYFRLGDPKKGTALGQFCFNMRNREEKLGIELNYEPDLSTLEQITEWYESLKQIKEIE